MWAETEGGILMSSRWVLYGYIKRENQFYINIPESEIVRKIFSLYINGSALKKIAEILTEERYFDEISKLYLQITALREEKKKIQIQMDAQEETKKEIKRINKLLEGFDISFGEFDDIVVRRIVDCIKVVNNEELLIIVKGGLEIKEKIHAA